MTKPSTENQEALSRDYLLSLLTYEPDTGLFRWRFGRPKTSKGACAGTLKENGYVIILKSAAK